MSHSTPEPVRGSDPRGDVRPDDGVLGGPDVALEPATGGGDPYAYPDAALPVTPTAPDAGTGAGGRGDASDMRGVAADQGREVAGTAKEQAGQVKDTAVEQGRQVADVARQEAGQVTQEARTQLRDLVGQGRSELTAQAGTQQQRLADYVHALADELGTMASSKSSGPLTDLAHRGSRKGGEVAHWLSEHEPGDVLEQVSGFARRRPFAFLGASLVAGVVVGRLTRSLAEEAKDDHDAQQADGPVEVGGGAGPDVGSRTAAPSYGGLAGPDLAGPDLAGPDLAGPDVASPVTPVGAGLDEPYRTSGVPGAPTGQAWLGEGR